MTVVVSLLILVFGWFVYLISSITCLFVLLAVHGILSRLLQHHNSKLSIFLLSAFLVVHDSQPFITAGKTNAFTIRHFGEIVMLYICLSIYCLALSLPVYLIQIISKYLLYINRIIQLWHREDNIPHYYTFSPSNTNSSISSIDIALVFSVWYGHSSPLQVLPVLAVILYFLLKGWCHRHIFLEFSYFLQCWFCVDLCPYPYIQLYLAAAWA